MQRQGVKVVASVEIDKKCQEVLAHRFPDSKIFDDVTTVKGSDLIAAGFTPSTGIITGGFPCQDLSVAGKRAGLAGERSGLFWEIARIVEETQTEYFVIENVPGLLSSNNGADFGVVLGTMADLGYSLGWRVLDAQHFGVPQRRRRVFIVGRRSTDRGVAEILFKSEGLRGYSPTSQQEGQDPTRETPSSFGQTGFAKYTPGVTTLTATTYKRPEDNVVVYKDPIGTLKARDYKGVNHEGARDGHIVVTSSSFGGYTEGVGTLRANGGDLGGGSENLVVHKE
jgi:DNA (cytosine-5)-methyltransferase 1